MPQPLRQRNRERFRIGRLIMVTSSISPLFLLWAIKGIAIIPDIFLIPCCIAIAGISSIFVLSRIRFAKKQHDKRELKIGSIANYDYHALTYIFAMLLPFYRQDINTFRELAAIVAALIFIIIIFWRLHLHYMNFIFVFGRYKTYLIHPPADGNPFGGTAPFILVTRSSNTVPGSNVIAYRVSDTVYLEESE